MAKEEGGFGAAVLGRGAGISSHAVRGVCAEVTAVSSDSISDGLDGPASAVCKRVLGLRPVCPATTEGSQTVVSISL